MSFRSRPSVRDCVSALLLGPAKSRYFDGRTVYFARYRGFAEAAEWSYFYSVSRDLRRISALQHA